jgi:hypothetical protein
MKLLVSSVTDEAMKESDENTSLIKASEDSAGDGNRRFRRVR